MSESAAATSAAVPLFQPYKVRRSQQKVRGYIIHPPPLSDLHNHYITPVVVSMTTKGTSPVTSPE